MSYQNMETFPQLHDESEQNKRHYYDLTISETLTASVDQSKRTLKTFTGVFCPVALAQFSSLLFLRLGCVLGQTGLVIALVQLVMAYVILVLTVLSICAISTNGAVEGGGVYFMISRTLGPEVGGSIGILFFLANVFSSALYMSGLVEGLMDDFGPEGRIVAGIIPEGRWWTYLFATCVCLFCLAVCLVGGSMFAKTNLFIFLAVFVCFTSVLVTFLFQSSHLVKIPMTNKVIYPHHNMSQQFGQFTGLNGTTFRKNILYDGYRIDFSTGNQMDFLSVFAIMFSGVTGIMNGANMSGELKQPAISIPKGTLAAALFTFICYTLSFLLSAATCERFLLLNNYLYMQAINFWRPFVLIGIIATCLSAGLGNLIGASRILYALAKDDIFGFLLKPAKLATKGGNPIASVVISFVLVQLVLFIGQLNLIAPVVSVFFLLAYASVNFACALLDLASASNFRPTFKYFSWHTSLLGVVCCLGMCFLVNYQYSIGIFILFVILIVALNFRRLDFAWGNIGQALLFHQVRKYLLLIDTRKEHVKYWRPQVLLLLSNPRSQASLVQFVNILKKGGLFVIGHVIKADFEKIEQDPAYEMQKKFIIMKDFLDIKAFIDVTIAPTIRDGCRQLSRLCGLGGLMINTVCIGFRDDSEPQDILQKINCQMNNLKSNWPFKPRHIPAFAELSSDFTGEQSTSKRLCHNISVDNSINSTSSHICVDENTRLVTKDRMKFLNRILRPSVDPKFIDELPPIRSTRQELFGEINELSANRETREDNYISNDQISEVEYVGIIADCMKMQKNICLCRHFENMDLIGLKASNSSECQYIDVWPINFFQPGSGSYLDNTCMFMLQLSCILNMSSQWSSKCKIRVYICLDYYTIGTNRKNVQELWNELLIQWRIQAEIKTVGWDDITMNLETNLGRKIMSNNAMSDEIKTISLFDCTLPDTYVKEVNNLIKLHTSLNTAVCFFYLPIIPNITKSQFWRKYINQLTLLTNDLPPSVFVRGLHEVITSAL
uniref:Solute carrier family 12 member 9 n=1 Tax=Schmidtea mediterranea TaxID=79327 RepID=A0A0H3YIX7_SCHMD|nr:slc12a-2 [Schmidtea mediterranea]